MTLQSMQPKVKRWQPVYAALLKTGVITTEEIRQIAGVGYNDVEHILMALTYVCQTGTCPPAKRQTEGAPWLTKK